MAIFTSTWQLIYGKKPLNEDVKKVIQKGIETYSQKMVVKPTMSLDSISLIIYLDNMQKAHWAYQVTFDVNLAGKDNVPAKPAYIINAKTLLVYASWDEIQTISASHTNKKNSMKNEEVSGGGFGGNLKMGKLVYDGLANNLPKLSITRDEKKKLCSLKNADLIVIDNDFRNDVTFQCVSMDAEHNNVYWNGEHDQVNGGYSPSNDLLYGGKVVKNMYQDWYGVPVLKPADAPITMVVHAKIDNAFWDGIKVVFGDGISRFYPLTSLGIVAHEISHGFTAQNSYLAKFLEAGGMNEAFSDMAAQAAEFYAYGKNSWQFAPEITKAPNEALRYMDQPSKDCKGRRPGDLCSIDDASQYIPGIDVHYSAGVYNRLFYIIAHSPGYNVKKAFDIMVKANLHYWTRTSTFEQGACGILSAAKDMGYDINPVKAALDIVKVKYDDC